MSFLKSMVRKFNYAVWQRVYSNEIICLFEMKQPREITVEGLTIKPVTTQNLGDAQSFQSQFQLRQFQRLMNEGNIGFYGYLDKVCIHRSWVITGPAQAKLHPLFSKKITEKESFIHYCETAPQARGKNIFTAVLSHIGRQFAGNKILISADQLNRSSIRSIKKSGFIECERIHLIIFFGIRLVKKLPLEA